MITFQSLEPTSVHLAATLMEEAIASLEEMLVSEVGSPKVERLERLYNSILNEREHLRKALEANDTEMILTSIKRLATKVSRALRTFKS